MATTTREEAGLTWEEVCSDPHLRDLPYNIETNEWGQIVMTATYLRHGAFEAEIVRQLTALGLDGQVIAEAAVQTTKGTKAADVAWCSLERWEEIKDDYDAATAPEICVEVLSLSNTTGEIEEKRQLYFEAGAEEVWTCSAEGVMRLFDADGALDASKRAPDFPARVEL